MLTESGKLLLVGDNPFNGISHLSEDRARARGNEIGQAEYAAGLVLDSLENGANGFMFSVSDATLSILQIVSKKTNSQSVALHAIVPYSYEYVRLATQLGNLGLGRKLAGRVVRSGDLRAIASGFKAVVGLDPVALMKTYVRYEKSRIMSSVGKRQELTSILLQEVITDMVVALNLDWFVKSYVRFVSGLGIKPGFETRNFAYLVNKFEEWNVDFSDIELVSSFNKVGFQMNPSKEACEKALDEIPECDVIAMSILAAGYIKLPDAVEYIEGLQNLKGMVVGVSKEKHAHDTFSFLRKRFSDKSHL
jgi:hypothetical protein